MKGVHQSTSHKLDLNLNLYGEQTLLVSVNSLDEEISLNESNRFVQFLKNYYNKSTTTINLNLIDSNINDYVFDKRLEDLRNLFGNYYVGLHFNFEHNQLSSLLVYYSSMVFHSQAIGLNEANSLVMAYETDMRITKIRTFNKPIIIPEKKFDFDSIMNQDDEMILPLCMEFLPFSILDLILGKLNQ